jgi:putative tricarboxylic transport membrane protein
MRKPITLQYRWLELLTAVFFTVVGGIVVYDSLRTGTSWGNDGPEPGYFPFYIGCILIASALWVAAGALRQWTSDKSREPICSPHQMRLVLQMFVPSLVFVLMTSFLGLYVAGMLYIAVFMVWQGKFGWLKSLIVGFGVVAVLFGLFELWFKVPLPKGPLEALFGF